MKTRSGGVLFACMNPQYSVCKTQTGMGRRKEEGLVVGYFWLFVLSISAERIREMPFSYKLRFKMLPGK